MKTKYKRGLSWSEIAWTVALSPFILLAVYVMTMVLIVMWPLCWLYQKFGESKADEYDRLERQANGRD